MDSWKYEVGLCPKMSSDDCYKYGTGIGILKIVDLLTQNKAPFFDINRQSTVQDFYKLLSIELLTSKLLVYT